MPKGFKRCISLILSDITELQDLLIENGLNVWSASVSEIIKLSFQS